MNSVILHASTVAFGRKAVLLLGPSGAGKSDLALQLIHEGARLVADDQTVLTLSKGALVASASQSIAGLLEVRGLGIVHLPPVSARVALAVQLGKEDVRLPRRQHWQPEKLPNAPEIPLIRLNGRHASDLAKIALALEAFAKGLFRDTFNPVKPSRR